METIIQRRLNSTSSSEEDGDSIFGKMISSELKNFDEDDKFEMKHEMYNIIYKYKLARRDKSRFEAAIAHTSSHIPARHRSSLLLKSQIYSPVPVQHYQSPSFPTHATQPFTSPTHDITNPHFSCISFSFQASPTKP